MTKILEVKNLSKSYSKNATAVESVSFSINEGEFVTLLGPSGCGKTTTLRMIAGFEYPDSGEVWLDLNEVTGLPPHKRPVNMMFQDFALWPHMTVAKNIAYGLKISGVKKAEIADEVSRVLELVDLKNKIDSFPQDLSIGQKQRIALARAIVKKPRILLLDEPMSALDAKLRESMQGELRALQKSLGMTFVMVTHDQVEAMRMSERIIIMSEGRVIQIGSPTELYETPATPYVADFLGQANILEAVVIRKDNRALIARVGVTEICLVAPDQFTELGTDLTLCIRPEKIFLEHISSSDHQHENVLQGLVTEVSYSGNNVRYEVKVEPTVQLVDDQQLTRSIASTNLPVVGDKVRCQIPSESISVFAGVHNR